MVDIDDTLLIGGKISRLFWWLSLQMQRIGRKLQRLNSRVASELTDYDEVVVLTGRDARELQFTRRQLQAAGVTFNKLICCPRRRLIDEWKVSIARELSKANPIVWIDDMIGEDIQTRIDDPNSNVTPLRPEQIAGARVQNSELEWL